MSSLWCTFLSKDDLFFAVLLHPPGGLSLSVGWFVGRVKQNLLNGFHGWRMGIFKFRVDGAILQLQNSTDLIKHLWDVLMITEGREQLMKPAAISTFGIQGLGSAAEEVKVLRCQLCSLTYFSMLGDGTGVDLEDVQTSLFIRQFDVWRTEVNVRSGACARTKPTNRGPTGAVKILRILRSSLPGRNKAGSRVSGLLVAMIILTLCSVSKPSIWFSSWQDTHTNTEI